MMAKHLRARAPKPFRIWGEGCGEWRRKGLLKLFVLSFLPLVLKPIPCLSQTTPAQSSQQAPKLVSPEVLGDNRVIFRLYAPNATVVTFRLEGSPAVAMEKDGQGIWSVTTPVLR